MDLTTFPEFTRESLAELGGWASLRGGRALLNDGCVKAIEWEHPVLKGKVEEDGTVYEPVLNLRSLTFVQNRCQCRTGCGGKVCPHAVALCLQAQRMEQEQPASAPSPSRSRSPSRPFLPQTWMVIDGSSKYLSIILRDRDHPQYRRCAEWLRSEGFRPEPSNGKWWMRDQHKVLNFLAQQRSRLERDYAPGYTDGFKQRTRSGRDAW